MYNFKLSPEDKAWAFSRYKDGLIKEIPPIKRRSDYMYGFIDCINQLSSNYTLNRVRNFGPATQYEIIRHLKKIFIIKFNKDPDEIEFRNDR